ncbi:flagellar hook protein FlgE [candidate division KSB1 bacterium]|nr:flagellar hook protein FlgE [candidate division KSB1 bacterium]
MMRALFSGVSGLANNQLKMDVIANNIANINTIGFKTSRISFSEELSQLIGSAQQNTSGGMQNAVMVGLGVRTGSIERDFSQGILQATGKNTDLGIAGDGFFVLNDGLRQLFTRAGNFHFDGNGRLVAANGSTIQGWTADQNGEVPQTAPLGNIVVDSTLLSPAIATRNISIAGNLDATADPVQEQWTASRTFTTTGGVSALATTELNALEQTTTPLVAGDTIEIAGTNFDGTPVTATFTYGAGNDGTTIQDLMNILDAAFTSTVALNNGKIELTDINFGESQTTITLSEGTSNTGSITLPGFINTATGFEPKTSTSIEVFDSLGAKHTLNVTFTKTPNTREWSFEIKLTGDEVITEGSTGTIAFASDGSLETITYSNGESLLLFDPNNGAAVMSVNLDFENQTGFSSITQFAGVSAVLLPFQDGQSQGHLSSFAIDTSGKILGTFTNGRSRVIAQLAIAKINNPEGLLPVGDNTYMSSASTGLPFIGKAGEDISASILSGTVEASNVDLAAEFVEMIIAQRAFQANSRVITVTDQILSEVTQLKR